MQFLWNSCLKRESVNELGLYAPSIFNLLAGQYAYYISGLIRLDADGTAIAVHVLFICHLARFRWYLHDGLLRNGAKIALSNKI